MSNVENKLIELVNSINTLSDSVNSVQGSITHLSEQISELEKKIAEFNTGDIIQKLEDIKSKVDIISEIKENLGLLSDLPSIRNMLAILDTKIEKLLSAPPEQPVTTTPTTTPQPSMEPSATVTSSEVLAPTYEIKEPEKRKEEYISPGLVEEEPIISTTEADAQVAIDAIRNKFKHISQMITPQSVAGSVLRFLEELRDEVETNVGMSPMLYEINSWLKKVDKLKEDEPLHPDIHSEITEKLDDWQDRVLAAIRRKYE
ncbi:MAG: hypothetical protein ACTSQE_00495 [Candidatus Heimdallarchaeaceae archaeon]